MTSVHDFHECLSVSHSAEDLPMWVTCYRQWFPGYKAMTSHREDGEQQRAGLDRSLVLSNGRQVWIDEKVRRRAYDDIALEYMSNTRTRAPGWVCKPLLADYIAYAILPTGKAYLLPVEQLQFTWKRHAEEWRCRYPRIKAPNNGYETLSCCVPVEALYAAMSTCLHAAFDPEVIA